MAVPNVTIAAHGPISWVPVDGGNLAVETITGTTAPVLAIHGVSSHRRLWNWLHAAAPEITLIAPDLRGRGDSLPVEGPSTIARHSTDLIAVLDAAGVDSIDVLGMSMGGFVAVDLATRYPDRVRSLTLVDGGFPMATPANLTPDLLPIVFADRLGRLEQTWTSLPEFAQFFSQTGPLLDLNDPLLLDYLAHDIDGGGKVRLSGAALLSDAGDIFFTITAWEKVDVPIRLSYAEWSVGADSEPAYSDDAIAGFRAGQPNLLVTEKVPGADHAASIMTIGGAQIAANLIRAAQA